MVGLSRERKLRATDDASACRARQMYQLSCTSGVVVQTQCKYIWNCQVRLSTVMMPSQFKAPAPAQPPHCYPFRHQPSPNGRSQAAHHVTGRCRCAMAAPWPRPGPSPEILPPLLATPRRSAALLAAAHCKADLTSPSAASLRDSAASCAGRLATASAAAPRPLVTPSSRQRASCCRVMLPHTAESGWPRLASAAAAQSVNAAQKLRAIRCRQTPAPQGPSCTRGRLSPATRSAAGRRAGPPGSRGLSGPPARPPPPARKRLYVQGHHLGSSSIRHSLAAGPPGNADTRAPAAASSRSSSAPVPQARVRPAPRSHTTIRTCCRLTTWQRRSQIVHVKSNNFCSLARRQNC